MFAISFYLTYLFMSSPFEERGLNFKVLSFPSSVCQSSMPVSLYSSLHTGSEILETSQVGKPIKMICGDKKGTFHFL